jgi:hypothetical protein
MTQTGRLPLKQYRNRGVKQDGPFGFRYYAIVYAIEAQDVGRIKFGRTLDVASRLSSLTGSSPVPLTLLGHVWLPDDAEAEIHRYLAADRSHCEWFLATAKVRHFAGLIAARKVMEIAELAEMSWMLVHAVPSRPTPQIDQVLT